MPAHFSNSPLLITLEFVACVLNRFDAARTRIDRKFIIIIVLPLPIKSNLIC